MAKEGLTESGLFYNNVDDSAKIHDEDKKESWNADIDFVMDSDSNLSLNDQGFRDKFLKQVMFIEIKVVL